VTAKTKTLWTFAITAIGVFMVTLDNLVVTTALPVIRRDLHANLQQLEWTVNGYALSFAVLLMTAAVLSDRLGRRRVGRGERRGAVERGDERGRGHARGRFERTPAGISAPR